MLTNINRIRVNLDVSRLSIDLNCPLTGGATKGYKTVSTMTANQVLTISDLAQLERVHYMTAYKWVRSGLFGDAGRLPRSNGKFYLIPWDVYEQWIAQGRPKHGKNNRSR